MGASKRMTALRRHENLSKNDMQQSAAFRADPVMVNRPPSKYRRTGPVKKDDQP